MHSRTVSGGRLCMMATRWTPGHHPLVSSKWRKKSIFLIFWETDWLTDWSTFGGFVRDSGRFSLWTAVVVRKCQTLSFSLLVFAAFACSNSWAAESRSENLSRKNLLWFESSCCCITTKGPRSVHWSRLKQTNRHWTYDIRAQWLPLRIRKAVILTDTKVIMRSTVYSELRRVRSRRECSWYGRYGDIQTEWQVHAAVCRDGHRWQRRKRNRQFVVCSDCWSLAFALEAFKKAILSERKLNASCLIKTWLKETYSTTKCLEIKRITVDEFKGFIPYQDCKLKWMISFLRRVCSWLRWCRWSILFRRRRFHIYVQDPNGESNGSSSPMQHGDHSNELRK